MKPTDKNALNLNQPFQRVRIKLEEGTNPPRDQPHVTQRDGKKDECLAGTRAGPGSESEAEAERDWHASRWRAFVSFQLDRNRAIQRR